MKKAILELLEVGKEYGRGRSRLPVLQGVSLAISPGEVVALTGPSGCGKTTLLNLAARLIQPTWGRVFSAPGVRLAYVFQEPRLLPWFTVEENLRFVQGGLFPEAEAKSLRSRILEDVGLAEFGQSYPLSLSGGMKQRLELARAFAVLPDLLLLDEPFKSLDVAARQDLYSLFQAERARQGFASLLVTHEPEEALLLADRVVVLSARPARVVAQFALQGPQTHRVLEEIRVLLAAG